MEETFYRKLDNGRYEAVSYYDSQMSSSFPVGDFIVKIRKDSRMQRSVIDLDYVSLQAAAIEFENELAQWILEYSKAHPKYVLSQKFINAWETFQKSVGNENISLTVDSAQDIASKFLERLCRKAINIDVTKNKEYNDNKIVVGNMVILRDDTLEENE